MCICVRAYVCKGSSKLRIIDSVSSQSFNSINIFWIRNFNIVVYCQLYKLPNRKSNKF